VSIYGTVRSIAVGLVLGLFAPGLSRAGNISISISPVVEIRDGALAARVQVTNSGDEAAHTVAPVLRFRDQEVRAPVREQLAPNQSMSAELSLPVGELGTGRWPYRLAVDYADANQYPFQALHVSWVAVGNPPPAKVAVAEVKADPMSHSGSLRVRVKNLAATARKGTLLVVAPEGVEVTTPEQPLTLAAWEEASLSAPLVNRTALGGSRYPVFVAAEYDDGGVHQAVIGQGTLEITNPRSFFQSQRQLLWLVAAAVIAGWVGFLLWQLSTGRLRRAAPRG
jgi:hypothetical protein